MLLNAGTDSVAAKEDVLSGKWLLVSLEAPARGVIGIGKLDHVGLPCPDLGAPACGVLRLVGRVETAAAGRARYDPRRGDVVLA
jgi:hypothetical protein